MGGAIRRGGDVGVTVLLCSPRRRAMSRQCAGRTTVASGGSRGSSITMAAVIFKFGSSPRVFLLSTFICWRRAFHGLAHFLRLHTTR
jgi:hypothetical protein